MKKTILLNIAATITLAMILSSCNRSTKSVTVNGKSYEVDTFVVNHYDEIRIQDALKRDAFVQQIIRPTNSSSFGQKKAEVHWRAFDENTKSLDFAEEVGEVTVVHYEHGLEIIKDGQSWYYDGFEYDDYNLLLISAGMAILHRPRWEPVKIDFPSALRGRYLYPTNQEWDEYFSVYNYVLYKWNINRISDALVYPNPIKKY
jgi:hypothetical protein